MDGMFSEGWTAWALQWFGWRLGEGSQGLKDIAKISLEISFKIPRFWDFWSLRQHRALRLHLEHTGCKRSLDANVGQDLRKSHWLTVSACFKKYFQPRDFVSFVSWEQFETKCLAISLRETLTQRDQTPFLIFLQKVSLPSKVGRLVVDCATSACNGGQQDNETSKMNARCWGSWFTTTYSWSSLQAPLLPDLFRMCFRHLFFGKALHRCGRIRRCPACRA